MLKQKMKLSLAVTWGILGSLLMPAQTARSLQQSKQSLVFVAPPPPQDIGEPGRRSEVGSRSLSCGKEKKFTALAPIYSETQLVLGVTTSQHPTFWFYTPYQVPFTGKFVLRDVEGELVYQTDVTLPQTPGVINVALPQNKTILSTGEKYRWYFKIYNKPQQMCSFVEGWVLRLPLNRALKIQLDKATPLARIALYAANGIWFDALNLAAELRQANPQETSWRALLLAVGLNDLANEPIILNHEIHITNERKK